MLRSALPTIDEEPLPTLYSMWLRTLLGGPIPRETKATCDHCAMLPDAGSASALRTQDVFDPSTKCCTYLPELPNYLVGGVLWNPQGIPMAPGQQTIRDRVSRISGVSPLGLGRSAVYDRIYNAAGSAVFGRSPTLRCPHYLESDGGRCGIWAHRNSVCTTWFCKHVRGAIGGTFWQSLQALLQCVERELSLWCCLQLGIEGEQLQAVLSAARPQSSQALVSELVGQGSRQGEEKLWGRWLGREIEFYIECARLVWGLGWQELEDLAGQELTARKRLLIHAYSGLIRPLVTSGTRYKLEKSKISAERIDGSHVRIVTYRSYDPVVVSESLWLALSSFDGRPTEVVFEALPADIRRELANGDLLRELVDHQVLSIDAEADWPSAQTTSAAAVSNPCIGLIEA